jgi:hypothetical protein
MGDTRLAYVAVGAAFALLIIAGMAYDVGVSSKSYQFIYAVPLNNQPGTVVFHLTNGGTLNLSYEFTRDDVQPNQMAAGGIVVVQYSFIGYPVQADYEA